MTTIRTVNSYPIDQYERHLFKSLETNQVLFVISDNGDGTSIRIPQLLASTGIYNKVNEGEKETNRRQICVTNPKRMAVIYSAQTAMVDLDCEPGTLVHCAVNVNQLYRSEQSLITYTSGELLINQMMYDPLLERYSVIIIDEIHERSAITDILLGLMKCILWKRKDLKLILCSSTSDIDEVSRFYANLSGVSESNQQVRTNILYLKKKGNTVKIYYREQPVANYLDASIDLVKNIHERSRLSSGKILIFLTAQDEVEHVYDRLIDYAMNMSHRLDLQQLLVLPLHSSLSHEEISKVSDEHGRNTRVCIVSTNIAEFSIHIPGVAHVIDSGFMKIKYHNYTTGIDSLVRVPISKDIAKQRAACASRTKAGFVYRLYPEVQYDRFASHSSPEILRCPLLKPVIMLKSLGVYDVTKFPLISKMPKSNLTAALELLYALQAIDEQGNLTGIGETMAQLDLDPRISKMLISLESDCCTQEVCRLAAVLQVRDIFSRKKTKDPPWSITNLLSLCASEGDMITYLNIISAFLHNQKSFKWAERRNLNYKALMNVVDKARELESQLKKIGLDIKSSAGRTGLIQKSVASGLFLNAAYLHSSGNYKTIRGDQTVYVHPTSVLSDVVEQPKYVVFAEIMNTTKPYMRHIMAVEQSQLLEAAPHYYNFTSQFDRDRST